MVMALIIDEGLAPVVNTMEEFMFEAQAYENSVTAPLPVPTAAPTM